MKTLGRFGSVGILCCAALAAQVATEANRRYQTPENRAQMARGFDRPERDARQKPQELVAAMDLRPGMIVVDIGTAAGYMLPFLSKAVGPEGRVMAQDIFDDFLEKAREKAKREDLRNVTFVKGTERDPNLPEGAVDVALALDSYHHYDYPQEMLAGIRKGLRDGGRFVLVEYYRRPGSMGGDRDYPLKHIRLDEDGVIEEIGANGFTLVSKRVHVEGSQYMLVFEKR
jgi:ubiquinone/menaquinone biosynthesis C-methylase UbiE